MRVFLSTVNITEQGTYCKRKLSFFIFSSYERSECFIAEWNEAASYCGALAKQCFIVRLLWSTASPYEAARCAMKRTFGAWSEAWRLHFFCLRQKNGRGCFNCSENVSQAQNGCKLVKNGYRFAKLRKYLCFGFFMQQRKIFCSIKRTFSPKQTPHAPKKDVNLRLYRRNKKRNFR